MKDRYNLVSLAEQKIKRAELEWEEANAEEIKQTGLYILDSDLVYEAVGECSDKQMIAAKQFALCGNFEALGKLIGPTIQAYLWQQACDEWKRHRDLKQAWEEDSDYDDHESLTTAQRNPDLCK